MNPSRARNVPKRSSCLKKVRENCQKDWQKPSKVWQKFDNSSIEVWQKFDKAWQKLDKSLTKVWQKFDKSLTKVWQKFDKSLTKVWQKFDKSLKFDKSFIKMFYNPKQFFFNPTFKGCQSIISLLVCISPECFEPVHVTVEEFRCFRILSKLLALALLLKDDLFLLVKLIQNLIIRKWKKIFR